MSRTGFVLAGGRSTRMGRDKALLPFSGATLIEHVARIVASAAGSVALVGDPARYANLGFPVIPDRFPDAGPLAGIHAALASSAADWNVIVACDMPALTPDFLRRLLDTAEDRAAGCLVPAGPSGRPEPLCAVYHRGCATVIEDALRRGVRKIMQAFDPASVSILTVAEDSWFANCNTIEDWAAWDSAAPQS